MCGQWIITKARTEPWTYEMLSTTPQHLHFPRMQIASCLTSRYPITARSTQALCEETFLSFYPRRESNPASLVCKMSVLPTALQDHMLSPYRRLVIVISFVCSTQHGVNWNGHQKNDLPPKGWWRLLMSLPSKGKEKESKTVGCPLTITSPLNHPSIQKWESTGHANMPTMTIHGYMTKMVRSFPCMTTSVVIVQTPWTMMVMVQVPLQMWTMASKGTSKDDLDAP